VAMRRVCACPPCGQAVLCFRGGQRAGAAGRVGRGLLDPLARGV
jgi:hypothetical protein